MWTAIGALLTSLAQALGLVRDRSKLKNSEAMRRSANSAAAQANRDLGNAAVARVEAKVEPPAQAAAADAPTKKLTPEQIEALEMASETDGSLDEIRRLSSGK